MKKFFTILAFSICFSTISIFATNISSTFTNNATLTLANSPYTITTSIDINSGVKVIVQDGVVINMANGAHIRVYGELEAKGATFTTADPNPAKGKWQGLRVAYEWNSYLGKITLDSCIVEYAQSIWVERGELICKNNTRLRNFSSRAIEVLSYSSASLENTTIMDCAYPIYMRSGSGSNNGGILELGDNLSLTGNTDDFIYIDYRDIPSQFVFKNKGIPYYFDSELRVTETGEMKVEPGVIFQGNTGAYINVLGKIKALGTKTNPITFTKHPGYDYWTGMNVNESSIDTACIFRNCIFSGSSYNPNSYNPEYSALDIISSSPTVDSCTFLSNTFNLYVRGYSNPVISNCSLGASASSYAHPRNVSVDWNANPIFIGDTLHFNGTEARAIGVPGHTVTDDAVLSPKSFVGLDSISYLLMGDIVIQDTASFTIQPGTVMKVDRYDYEFTMNGPVTAIGTPSKPIIYTHRNDDSFGYPKDTYNDGTTSISHSNSGRLLVYSKQTSTLQNWKIHYGGYSSNYYPVYIRNGNIIKDCDIRYSHRGVYFYNDAQVINNHFEEIDWYPVARYLDSGNPTLLGNTVQSVGYLGIFVAGFAANDTFNVQPMDFAGITNTAYIVDDNLDIPEKSLVTIEPGVVFKYQQNGRFLVRGGLSATGTKNNKIIFTSIHDDSASGDTNNNGTGSTPLSGHWYGIAFHSTSMDDQNNLKNCELRYVGSYPDVVGLWEGSIRMLNCKVTIDSILVNFANGSPLAIYGDANPVITNSEFFNLGNAPVYMDMFSNPTFSGNQVANLPRIGLRLRGQTLSGTVPIRNFGGYDTIAYIMDEHMTVNDHLIIPAGLTFKSNGDDRWYIYGKFDVQGTAKNPVVFTCLQDDMYGNPRDMEQNNQGTLYNRGSHIYFYDASDDNSVINHALFRYSYTTAIVCYNSSPTIKNTTFENFSEQGVSLSGPSMPAIDSCTFNNIGYPFACSLVTYPSSTQGNVISGTTGKGIRVYNEVLNSNVTLEKKDFAGITNIPYVFKEYEVGSSAILTIKPGVICKFINGGYMDVKKGLNAIGGSTPDSAIVFTADQDDFYGGDTYSNGDASLPGTNHWFGVYFYNESLDGNCEMKNCIVKHAGRNYYTHRGGVTLDNSSPKIKNCLFDQCYYGIAAHNNNANVVIDQCDFINIQSNAINNFTPANIIKAENCWWNHNTGPYNAALNPTGQGEPVSDGVDFDPWATQLAKPELGDASLNGEIKPYDAALVLQHAATLITLSAKQLAVSDVSKNGFVTAYDAALILQYTVGLITKFDEDGLKSAALVDAYAETTENYIAPQSRTFEVPVSLTSSKGVKALDFAFSTNTQHIRFTGLKTNNLPNTISVANGYNKDSGTITIAMASAYDLNLNSSEIILVFEMAEGLDMESKIQLTNLLANEQAIAQNLSVTVSGAQLPTGISLPKELSAVNVYSVNQICHINLNLKEAQNKVLVTFNDLSGKTTNQLVVNNMPAGAQSITSGVSSSGDVVGSGIYIVTIKGDNFSVAYKLMVQ